MAPVQEPIVLTLRGSSGSSKKRGNSKEIRERQYLKHLEDGSFCKFPGGLRGRVFPTSESQEKLNYGYVKIVMCDSFLKVAWSKEQCKRGAYVGSELQQKLNLMFDEQFPELYSWTHTAKWQQRFVRYLAGENGLKIKENTFLGKIGLLTEAELMGHLGSLRWRGLLKKYPEPFIFISPEADPEQNYDLLSESGFKFPWGEKHEEINVCLSFYLGDSYLVKSGKGTWNDPALISL